MIFGALIGAVLAWLALRAKSHRAFDDGKAANAIETAALNERLSGKDAEVQELRARVDSAQHKQEQLEEQFHDEATRRAAAEQDAARIPSLEQQLSASHEENRSLRSTLAALETMVKTQEATAEEKLQLLLSAREELSTQFKSLAGELFDQKSRSFSEQSKSDLNTLLNPLAQKIQGFERIVQEVYVNESRERFSLQNEVKQLRDLNVQLSQEANNLANALKGQSKTQGTWGEIILERVLEMSGLVRGREYEIQVTLTDQDGRRSCPDVIISLPESRHLVIDSKVNVVAYERYCSLPDGELRDKELRTYITAFRKHIKDLDIRSYQDHYKLNSLNFVLMFVPIEGALMLALQSDSDLWDEAFKKNIVIVSPSTLLATMKTITNLWRQEKQNRYALKIAIQAGRLYDKFAAFVKDIEDIGSKLRSAQETCEEAQKKLTSGRGNIVKTIDGLKVLGARAKKQLSDDLVQEAIEEHEIAASELLPEFNAPAAEDEDDPQLSFIARAGDK
ncbi:MAG TPA: DNA recombination protein RmuC [Pyrinomonadaceae bacterium]|nr:DNA recombination protein RmuC [Pyrinomonadaceae bacterium]